MEKKTIIIKIGSQILLTERGRVDEFRMAHILDQIKLIWERGWCVILVVSGAVALGMETGVFHTDDSFYRQAAAGMGQVKLTSCLSKICVQKKIEIAQILLTPEIFIKTDCQNNLKQLFTFYFQNQVLPIVNENDVLSLNCFGGNDFLAARLARLLSAQKVVMLSGFQVLNFAIGGAKSKIEAQKILQSEHIKSVIVNGKARNCIVKNI